MLFIFDMDHVLADFDRRTRMAALEAVTGVSVAELRRRWWRFDTADSEASGELAAEAGLYPDGDAYLAAFRAATGTELAEDDWVRARAAATRARPGMIAVAREASRLGDIALLTNNGPLASRHLAAIAPEVVEVFAENAFTSSDLGARKPDPVVYERLLARLGAAPADAFFADDLAENVAGARSVGITAFQVLGNDPGALRAAITDFARAR